MKNVFPFSFFFNYHFVVLLGVSASAFNPFAISFNVCLLDLTCLVFLWGVITTFLLLSEVAFLIFNSLLASISLSNSLFSSMLSMPLNISPSPFRSSLNSPSYSFREHVSVALEVKFRKILDQDA